MLEWIIGLIERRGYVGILLLTVAEHVFPPIPSAVVMPAAGFATARGDLALALVVLAGAVGSTLGSIAWYGVGRGVGEARLRRWAASRGRWFAVDVEDLDRSDRFFERHAGKAVLLGSLVPGVRTFIAVPAGVHGMPLARFALFAALGSTAWVGALALAGWSLRDRWQLLDAWLSPASNVLLGVLVAAWVWRALRRRPTKGSARSRSSRTDDAGLSRPTASRAPSGAPARRSRSSSRPDP
jgi:membrane protein DedA with SNARE-associated domain